MFPERNSSLGDEVQMVRMSKEGKGVSSQPGQSLSLTLSWAAASILLTRSLRASSLPQPFTGQQKCCCKPTTSAGNMLQSFSTCCPNSSLSSANSMSPFSHCVSSSRVAYTRSRQSDQKVLATESKQRFDPLTSEFQQRFSPV